MRQHHISTAEPRDGLGAHAPGQMGSKGTPLIIELLAMLMAVAAGFRLFIRGWWSDGKANTDPTTKA